MELSVEYLLKLARSNGCSDVHFTTKAPPVLRLHGELVFNTNIPPLKQEDMENLIYPILNPQQREIVENGGDVDLSYSSEDGNRHRVNIYHQKGCLAAAFRLLQDKIPSFEQLKLPKMMEEFSKLSRGLVIVTGPTGSGKSTTLAAMTDYINTNMKKHIITIEDPIEYEHNHKKSMINQRELGLDVDTFSNALRSSLREDPDVILVGEMRDLETIRLAITAAETGHLVLSTLHTTGASTTVDRMIDVFPENQQNQIRTQLSTVLKGVVSQLLIPTADGKGRIAALEVLNVTDSIASLIRENKGHQMDSVIQTSSKDGMQSLDVELARMVNSGIIKIEDAIDKCMDYDVFKTYCTVNTMQTEYSY